MDALARALQPRDRALPEERRGVRRSTPVSSTRFGRDDTQDHLSGDVRLQSSVDPMTAESIGADQVWAGADDLPRADRARASRWR